MSPREIRYNQIFEKHRIFFPDSCSLQHQFRLLPNIISISRFILILPILILYNNPSPYSIWIVFSLLILSYLSDYADGYFARKLSQQSMLGLILDPLVDKIWTAALIILLCLYRDLPLWIASIVILRDVGIIYINTRIYIRHKFVMPSNEFGRTYMVLMGLLIIGLTAHFEQLIWLAYLLVGLALFTWFKYLNNYLRVMHNFQRLEQTDPGGSRE